MAHYALINKQDNIVVNVITGVDETVTQSDNGTPVGGSTEAWEQFYENQPWHFGFFCKRTSRSNAIRKQFAGIGYSYNIAKDIFVQPQPYPSWTLDDNDDWQAPTLMPDDGGIYYWFEQKKVWIPLE